MSTKRGAVKKGPDDEREAWREKLLFLSDAMESTARPFVAGSSEGSTMIFNEAFCRLTGYTREELYHLNWATDLTTPESLTSELKAPEVLGRTREPQRYEKYYRRKGGDVIPIDLLTHVACDSQGNILFYYWFITDISEHKGNEDELRRSHDTLRSAVLERTAALSQSEERLRMMIDASPVPMVVFEENKNYFINKKFVETFGYTMDDIPSVNEWWPLAYPDEDYREYVKQRWYAAVDEAVKNRTTIEPQEVIVTCKDSSQKHVLNYFSSIGELNVTVFYDITERKMTAEALRKSEERFRSYFELPLIGIAITSPEKGWIQANDRICDLLGYPRNELMKMTWDRLTHPDDLQADVRQFNRLMSGDSDNYILDKRFIRKDGSVIFTTISIGCVRKPDGAIDYFVCLMQDITERKQAEERLAHVASFPELNPAPILEIDDDGKITYSNPAANSIFPDLAVLGSNHPAIKGIVACEDSFSQTECRQYVRDIEINGIYYQQTILRMPERRTTRIYCTDITERKRAEEDAIKAKAQAELYLDLMSHDISNMHQIAMGYLELAQEILQLEEEQKELIDQPAEVLGRSAQLISNVRKLRQNQEGLFQDRTMDMCSVLADVRYKFGAVPGKNVTLNLNGSNSCQIRANELLYDVFANLVSNAIKHTESRAEIRISLERAEDNGRQWYKVSVEDDGPGIPDDFKEKVFNRLLKSTMRAKGMGLGLYLVKSLVASYHGKVWVEDRMPGDHTKGAKFVVLLPALSKNDN